MKKGSVIQGEDTGVQCTVGHNGKIKTNHHFLILCFLWRPWQTEILFSYYYKYITR